MEDGWSAFKILTSKPTGERLGKPRHGWGDCITIYLKEICINMGN